MFDQLLSVLFPERCRSCNKNNTAVCTECIRRIPLAATIYSDIPSCALYDYGDKIVQQAVWELKYHRKSGLAKALVRYGAAEVVEFLSGVTQSVTPLPIVLVPIPQHYTKTFSRGFNQSLSIAKWFHSAMPYATVQALLRKGHATTSQARAHNRYERQKNLAHTMSCKSTINKKVLYVIVDDVITTGSTIREAGRALRAAGAHHICAISLAHGYSHH